MDYPLTHAQKRIWYTEQFYPGTSISNLAGFAKLKSEKGIDHRLLMEASQHVVVANESMRLRLELDDDGEVSQYVAPYEKFEIEWFDYSETGEIRAIMEWAQLEVRKPFLLYGNRLFHFAVFRISTSECWFFAKVHHVIADGISIVLLGNQIVDHYLEMAKGNAELPIDQPSYTEYMVTEADYEISERFQKDKKFWKAKYESVPESVSLKRSDSYRVHTDAVRLSKTIAPDLHREIQAFCDKNSVSPLALFLSVMYIYMQRLTGQEEVTVGTFMGNRTNAREKQMLGMFVSTIPMKAHIDEQLDFLTFVGQNMKELMSVIRHQKYPYDTLINNLRENHGDLKRLFGISLEYQVMQWQEKEDLSLLIEPIFSGHEINDISIHVKDRWDTGTLNLDFDYRAELFTEEEMEHLFVRMMTLLEDLLIFPDKRIGDLELIPEEEKRRILTRSKDTEMWYDREITLHELFERQAIQNPLCTAVICEGREVTYQELREQADRLGGLLRKKGISADGPVAIVMERTERVVTAILGILKAGGAYVPIDPGFPEERIRFIIEDSGAKVIIAERHLAEKYELQSQQSAEVLIFDDRFVTEEDTNDLTAETSSRSLAYIIYTSGTTGKPKGVMIEHRQVHHLIEALRDRVYANYERGLNVALLAPFHFDASVQQIFASLLLGHTLHIVPRMTVSDGQALADYYRKNGIEVTDGTPSHLKLLAAAEDLSGLPLRHMLIGGEALPRATVGKLFERLAVHGQAPTITNVYGPTESCVDASVYDIVPGQFQADNESVYMPIGKPLGNNRVYIMDAYGRLLPDGVEGELCIAGDGVGRGYLNLPDFTSSGFVGDPFVSEEKMYKTGDLGHWLPDGNLAFGGRIDDQVKIRGYRIELGEIEAVMQQFPGIAKAVVLARPEAGAEAQSGMELCAYVVWNQAENPLSVSELKDHLSHQLPDYMLPPYFVELEEIPLTSSGKVDRKALLRHEVKVVGVREYVAPTNAVEAQFAQIWQDILGVERVGIYDSFFEMGGHSLKAMTLLARTAKAYGVEVPLRVLFETPTVYAIAQYVSDLEPQAFLSIKR
ncbi:MAG: lchAA, partial [Cohnella sp.]|nr:lchAA [Cohnella sp.]